MGIGLQIAGGFGRRLSQYMQEKEKFDWENKRAERKFGMTTGQLGVKKAEEKAGIVVDKVKYLQERGLDNNILRYAFDQEKIAGIDKLYNEVLEGSDQATGEQLNRLVNVSKDYAATDNRPWTEVVKEAMQIYATPENAAKHTDQQKQQKGFWAAMLADPSTTSGYDDTQRYDGYTRADQDRIIMASATTPRGEGLLKIDRTARIEKMDARDYRALASALEDNYNRKENQLINSIRKMPNAAGVEQEFVRNINNEDFWSITAKYGDKILAGYLEQERLAPTSVTNNMAVGEGIREWVKSKTDSKYWDRVLDKSMQELITDSRFSEAEIKSMPVFDSIIDAKKAKNENKISKGNPILIYDPVAGIYKMDLGGSTPEIIQTENTGVKVTDIENYTVDPKPEGGRSVAADKRAWDAQYKGIYNNDGTMIFAGPRPPQTNKALGVRVPGIDKYKQWNDKYGETHNPITGWPKIARFKQ